MKPICSLVVTDKPSNPCLGMVSNSILALGFSSSVHIITFDGSKLSVKETVDLDSNGTIYEMAVLKGEILWSEQKSTSIGRIVWPGGLKL